MRDITQKKSKIKVTTLLDGQIAEGIPFVGLYGHTDLAMFEQWILGDEGTIHPPGGSSFQVVPLPGS